MAEVQKQEIPGKLIAVEGLDGSGKSTQVYLLKRWLELDGYKVIVVQSRDLNDPQAVRQHLRNIALALGRTDLPVFNEA